MTHAHDDIRVGTLRLPFIGNGWLMPWGEVVSNPLKAQRLGEEYRERQEAAQIRAELETSEHIKSLRAQRAA
ncbi:DUF1317 family protein [Enterobacter hormaechei]